MLKIVIPNKGALSNDSLDIITKAGYRCKRRSKELLCQDLNSNIEFIFLRPKDIPTYVNDGIFDFGITGRDIVQDTNFSLNEILPLNFGKSAMHFIIKQDEEFSSFKQFEGKNIACSYPTLLKNFLAKNDINANIVKLDGAIEIAIHLGIADVVVDVVETGTTIREAGLKTVGNPILKSEAVLISSKKNILENKQAKMFVERIESIILAKQYVMVEYDIPTKNLEEACNLVNGLESPTVSPLQNPEWKAVKVLVKHSSINEIMCQLSDIGAKAIIVTEVKSCRI